MKGAYKSFRLNFTSNSKLTKLGFSHLRYMIIQYIFILLFISLVNFKLWVRMCVYINIEFFDQQEHTNFTYICFVSIHSINLFPNPHIYF